jgi:hypothetical protein
MGNRLLHGLILVADQYVDQFRAHVARLAAFLSHIPTFSEISKTSKSPELSCRALPIGQTTKKH